MCHKHMMMPMIPKMMFGDAAMDRPYMLYPISPSATQGERNFCVATGRQHKSNAQPHRCFRICRIAYTACVRGRGWSGCLGGGEAGLDGVAVVVRRSPSPSPFSMVSIWFLFFEETASGC